MALAGTPVLASALAAESAVGWERRPPHNSVAAPTQSHGGSTGGWLQGDQTVIGTCASNAQKLNIPQPPRVHCESSQNLLGLCVRSPLPHLAGSTATHRGVSCRVWQGQPPRAAGSAKRGGGQLHGSTATHRRVNCHGWQGLLPRVAGSTATRGGVYCRSTATWRGLLPRGLLPRVAAVTADPATWQ